MTRRIARPVLGVCTALALALGVVPAVPVSPAHAAVAVPGDQTLVLSPAGPYVDGETVTVTGSGFVPVSPINVGLCDAGRQIRGPGDCGASDAGYSLLVSADDQGRFVTTLPVVVGPLLNQQPPAITCGPSAPCRVTAVDIADVAYSESVPIWFQGTAEPAPDATGPVTTLSSTTGLFTTGTSSVFGWDATDGESGVIAFEVVTRPTLWDGSVGPATELATANTFERLAVIDFGIRPGQVRCVSARARDAAGNVGEWTTDCASRALDDRALKASKSWARRTGAGNLNRTVTVTTTHGAKLRLRGAHAHRLALVATHCPTCGTVAVSVGGRRIGVVHLRSKHRHRKVVTALPFRPRNGTVVITVLSKHKKVQIDGLVVSAA